MSRSMRRVFLYSQTVTQNYSCLEVLLARIHAKYTKTKADFDDALQRPFTENRYLFWLNEEARPDLYI